MTVFRGRDKRRLRSARGKTRERGAAAVEFALIAPLLLALVMGIIDYGVTFGQYMSLQQAAREGARQGALQGDVIASTRQARGMLDDTRLQIAFSVNTSGGSPGVMVVCVRYPQSSLTGLYSWALAGVSQTKAVMRMEGPATTASGQTSDWGGGTCAP